MRDKKFDSTSAVSRFSRDKRTRVTSERVERSPRPRRDADNEGHTGRVGRTDAKRASYNPNFSADNRMRDERPRRDFQSEERQPRPQRGGGRFEKPVREDGGYGKSRFADKSSKPNRQRGEFSPRGKGQHAGRNGGERSYPKYAPSKQSGDMRLNRFLAQSGLCSRREADDLITAGLVTVNGQIVTELGTKVRSTDEVKFNDSKVQGEKKVYLVLNKPKGYVTSLEDPHADKTVMELVKGACSERIYPVGRLDKNSLGLLLFTNDGDIYADEIAYVSDNKKEVGIEIHSGRNRIVRRIFEHMGYVVQKLDRVYYAGITKKNLKRGQWRFLTREEVDRLKSGRYE